MILVLSGRGNSIPFRTPKNRLYFSQLSHFNKPAQTEPSSSIGILKSPNTSLPLDDKLVFHHYVSDKPIPQQDESSTLLWIES